jgi:Antibiotic biosynthesis monooxygenase
MIAILYRWKLKEDKIDQFIAAWSEITLALREDHGGLGSRLHLGEDGFFYGYAQWNSLRAREIAFANFASNKARKLMLEAIVESFPEVILEVKKDLLLPNHG